MFQPRIVRHAEYENRTKIFFFFSHAKPQKQPTPPVFKKSKAFSHEAPADVLLQN